MDDNFDLKSFLHSVKHVDIIDFIPSEKNRNTRLRIGLTAYEQEEIVRNLTIKNYFSGPLKDNDSLRNGNIWVFKHNYKGNSIYI